MDKEIIIDGVGCAFYNNGKCENPNGMSCNCINTAVCYYKELKRLEQENARLKNERTADLAKQIDELKAELQKFKDMAKKGLDEFKDVGGCWGCGLQLQLYQDMEDIKQLKAENELLKNERTIDLRNQLEQLKAENESYEYQLEKRIEICDSWMNLSNKYKQCLDEIENIINNFADEDIITLPDLSKEKNYKLIAEQYAEPIKQIMEKIKQERKVGDR